VIPAIGPEEFGESENPGVGGAIDISVGMRDDQLQNPLLAQTEMGELIVDDGVDGDGRLRQPVRKRLLASVETMKAIGFELNESGGSHANHAGLRRVSGSRLRPAC